MTHHTTDWLPAHLLETYHQLTPIGTDEVVAVFRGYEATTGRDVAVKVLLPDLCANPRAVSRFREEAHAAAELVHANIVKIQTIDEAAGVPYLVTPRIPAESLRAKLSREQVLPLHTTRAIIAQVGAALTYAHQHGIIHRGLTPDRIFVTKAGHVHVADFGIAAARHIFSLTQVGMVMGMPEYLPPESITGAFTTRSDLYALAVIVYELCTGSVPFHDDDPLTTMRRQAHEPPVPLSEQGIAVAREFERALLKALDKHPEKRFSDVETMLRVLGARPSDSIATTGTRRHLEAGTTIPRPPAPDEPSELSLPTQGGDEPVRRPRAYEFTNWPAVRQRLATSAPTKVVPLVALLLIVVAAVLIASVSPRSFAGGPTEPAERTLAGTVTHTTMPSSTKPPDTPVTGSRQQAAAGFASTPTRMRVAPATAMRTVTVVSSATATQAPSAAATHTPPPATATATVAEVAGTSPPARTLTPLNIRSGPGVAFPVSGGLQAGVPVTVLGQSSDGEWLYVIVPVGTEGWIARAYTTFEGTAPLQPAPTLPATASPVVAAVPSATTVPPATSTPTTLSAIQYQMPILQVPTEGATHRLPIELQWTWNGTLAEDEYFDVRLWQEGEPHLGVAWTKSSQLRLGNSTLRGTYQWTVVVVRGENGQWVADLSPEATPRTLVVLEPDQSDGGTDQEPPPQPTQPPPQPTQPPQPQPSPTR